MGARREPGSVNRYPTRLRKPGLAPAPAAGQSNGRDKDPVVNPRRRNLKIGTVWCRAAGWHEAPRFHTAFHPTSPRSDRPTQTPSNAPRSSHARGVADE